MPTTRDRMEAVAADIKSVIDAADSAGRDINADELSDVQAKTAELAELRKTFEADRAARDAVRDIGTLAPHVYS